MRRLVLSPHMDDESMGCGGLLSKYGDECRVITVAHSGSTREGEHRRAMELLGVTDYRCLGYEDGSVSQHMPELVGAFDDLMRDYRPDEVYLPYPSSHQDHIATYDAGIRSSRMSMSHVHWFPPSVLVYDVVVYDVNLYATELRWNVFEELTEDQAAAKEAACRCYISETPAGPHPLTSIKEIAGVVGKTHHMQYAEQYALVREIRR